MVTSGVQSTGAYTGIVFGQRPVRSPTSSPALLVRACILRIRRSSLPEATGSRCRSMRQPPASVNGTFPPPGPAARRGIEIYQIVRRKAPHPGRKTLLTPAVVKATLPSQSESARSPGFISAARFVLVTTRENYRVSRSGNRTILHLRNNPYEEKFDHWQHAHRTDRAGLHQFRRYRCRPRHSNGASDIHIPTAAQLLSRCPRTLTPPPS